MTPRAPDSEPLRTFDWTEQGGPAQAVVAAVADATGEDPIELEPIYGAVDPDALDELLTPHGPTATPLEGSVTFEYRGYDVVVMGHGRGYLYDQDVSLRVAAGQAAERVDE